MKRLCLILAFLFLFTQTASAMPLLIGQKVVYRGTVTGLRISAVDGTAFLDALSTGTLDLAVSPLLHTGSLTQANTRMSAVAGTSFIDTDDATFATNLSDHLGKYLVIKDSAGKKASAWIKAAGTGETLTDLIAEWDLTSGWVAFAATINDADTFTTAGAGGVRKDISGAAGALVKLTASYTTTASGVGLMNYGNSATYLPSFVTGGYRTLVDATGIYIRNYTAGQTDITSMSIEQVLTPSATGVTITSTKGGTAMDNWESVESGFNYNDSTGYTYYIYDRDITALADGNHQIEIYDSNNKMLRGVLKAAGSGTFGTDNLGADLVSGWDFTSGWELISAGSIVDANSYVSGTSTYHGIRTTASILVSFRLYKVSWDGSSASATVQVRRANASGDILVTGFGTGYGTITADGKLALLNSDVATQTDVTSLSLNQITAPSTLGATIVSAKGGTTYNFSYKNPSFTYNAASYYVIIRAIR